MTDQTQKMRHTMSAYGMQRTLKKLASVNLGRASPSPRAGNSPPCRNSPITKPMAASAHAVKNMTRKPNSSLRYTPSTGPATAPNTYAVPNHPIPSLRRDSGSESMAIAEMAVPNSA